MNTTSFEFYNLHAAHGTKAVPTPTPCPSPSALRGLFRHWSLKRRRAGQTYESFACFFAGQGIPEPILEETYHILAQRVPLLPSFPVHPLDSLREVYHLDCYRGDALTDLMNAVRKASCLEFSRPVPVFLPCETVADFVYLLAARCDAMYLPTGRSCPVSPFVEGNFGK